MSDIDSSSPNKSDNCVRSSRNNDHWMRAYWRPAMGFTYMVICIFDFIIFPIMSMVQPLFMKLLGIGMPYVVWQSLTLQTGGFFHIAMGAVLGVAAWSRGQEKIAKTT
tara:strand:- start:175 stop:498 length:324 start_codon:yes stop_codon:yes gene_type:complete